MYENIFLRAFQAFHAYVDSFRDASGKLEYAMQAKLGHTEEVRRITDLIMADGGSFSDEDRLTFRLCALFHDVSRFEQILRFHTFLDAASFDHGNRSAELIVEKHFLDDVSEKIRSCVINAVRVHNKLAIPADLPPAHIPAAKMVRDADKLAILRLVIRFFQGHENDPSIRLDLPDTPSFSDSVLETVKARQCVRYTDLKNVNEFKLALFAWVNDLNYGASFALASREDLFGQVRALLPEDPRLDELLRETRSTLSARSSAP